MHHTTTPLTARVVNRRDNGLIDLLAEYPGEAPYEVVVSLNQRTDRLERCFELTVPGEPLPLASCVWSDDAEVRSMLLDPDFRRAVLRACKEAA